MTLLNWVQLVALATAGLFFLVKLAQGWLMVNVNLSATIERRENCDEPEHDDVALAVTVTKGGNGSVRIQDTSVLVTSGDEVVAEGTLVGTSRLKISPGPNYQVSRPWQAEPQAKSLYRLPPGEETVWSAHLTVPAGAVCVIQVAILGRQWPTRFPAQWRCSLVSLPTDCKPRHRSSTTAP